MYDDWADPLQLLYTPDESQVSGATAFLFEAARAPLGAILGLLSIQKPITGGVLRCLPWACKLTEGACRSSLNAFRILEFIPQSWREAEAGAGGEEAVEGVAEGDLVVMKMAAMSLEKSSRSDQRWVCLH